MSIPQPYEDMTSYLTEKMSGADLLGLLATTMTELDRRGAEIECGAIDCRPRSGAEAVLQTAWASIHHHDDDGVYQAVFFTDESLGAAVDADRESITEPCTLGHAEHARRWQSWRDDCDDCGFCAHDQQQCDLGHPDDGVTGCGYCGYRIEQIKEHLA